MIRKQKIKIVVVSMVFSITCILQSCRLFDDFLTIDEVHGNKVVFQNKTSNSIYLEWYKTSNKSEISMDYTIYVGEFHEYEERENVYEQLIELINSNFILKVSKGNKHIEYNDLTLQMLPDTIHSITNVNSWVKDYYVLGKDTFDILTFTFTDNDFE